MAGRFGAEALPRLTREVLGAAAEIGGALGGPASVYRSALAALDGAADGVSSSARSSGR